MIIVLSSLLMILNIILLCIYFKIFYNLGFSFGATVYIALLSVVSYILGLLKILNVEVLLIIFSAWLLLLIFLLSIYMTKSNLKNQLNQINYKTEIIDLKEKVAKFLRKIFKDKKKLTFSLIILIYLLISISESLFFPTLLTDANSYHLPLMEYISLQGNIPTPSEMNSIYLPFRSYHFISNFHTLGSVLFLLGFNQTLIQFLPSFILLLLVNIIFNTIERTEKSKLKKYVFISLFLLTPEVYRLSAEINSDILILSFFSTYICLALIDKQNNSNRTHLWKAILLSAGCMMKFSGVIYFILLAPFLLNQTTKLFSRKSIPIQLLCLGSIIIGFLPLGWNILLFDNPIYPYNLPCSISFMFQYPYYFILPILCLLWLNVDYYVSFLFKNLKNSKYKVLINNSPSIFLAILLFIMSSLNFSFFSFLEKIATSLESIFLRFSSGIEVPIGAPLIMVALLGLIYSSKNSTTNKSVQYNISLRLLLIFVILIVSPVSTKALTRYILPSVFGLVYFGTEYISYIREKKEINSMGQEIKEKEVWKKISYTQIMDKVKQVLFAILIIFSLLFAGYSVSVGSKSFSNDPFYKILNPFESNNDDLSMWNPMIYNSTRWINDNLNLESTKKMLVIGDFIWLLEQRNETVHFTQVQRYLLPITNETEIVNFARVYSIHYIFVESSVAIQAYIEFDVFPEIEALEFLIDTSLQLISNDTYPSMDMLYISQKLTYFNGEYFEDYSIVLYIDY